MSDTSFVQEEVKTEVVYVAEIEESSEEPPMEEWSSLVLEIVEENVKRIKYDEGLYHPGSGEICAKHITMSDSEVLRHPYYNYPAILDPGIEQALLGPEPKIVYPDDGQELYLAVCKQMNECPVKTLVRGLIDQVIDLRYYCVSSKGVRAMSLALSFNRIVRVLHLTDNFLDPDACFHLGEMLSTNSTMVELNLSGCNIGPEGVKRILNGLTTNRSLRILNLDRNQLTDEGMVCLATAVFQGMDVQEISLSYNNIGGKGTEALAEVLETYNKFTRIDLSWNNLFTPVGVYNLLVRLGESKVLEYLNLSWNSMSGARLGAGLKNLLSATTLRNLNLSNNRLSGGAITSFLPGLPKAKKLAILDLSFNPMTPDDALKLLNKVKGANVKVQKILMENIFVDGEFLTTLSLAKQTKAKKNLFFTYGGVIGVFTPKGVDMRNLVLDRAEFLAKKSKKRPVDIALVAMEFLKDKNEVMPTKDFCTAMRRSGAPLDDDLLEEMAAVFAGPRTPKSKTIDIKLLVDYMKRKWPDRKLPPTPPPEPEPEPVPKGKGAKGKAKKK